MLLSSVEKVVELICLRRGQPAFIFAENANGFGFVAIERQHQALSLVILPVAPELFERGDVNIVNLAHYGFIRGLDGRGCPDRKPHGGTRSIKSKLNASGFEGSPTASSR